MLGVTAENRDWMRARSEFAEAMKAAPDNDVMFYNLGLIFARNGLFDDAIAEFARLRRRDRLRVRSSVRAIKSLDHRARLKN